MVCIFFIWIHRVRALATLDSTHGNFCYKILAGEPEFTRPQCRQHKSVLSHILANRHYYKKFTIATSSCQRIVAKIFRTSQLPRWGKNTRIRCHTLRYRLWNPTREFDALPQDSN